MTAPLIYGQMAKVAKALSHIPKQRSSGVKYEFRSVDAVMNHLHGPLAEHGVVYVPRVLDDWKVSTIPGSNNREQTQALFRVEVTFYAEDGSSVVASGLAQSHDYGDKAVYQASQNAIKYLLLQAFCIPVDEPDMDGREPDEVPANGNGGQQRRRGNGQQPPSGHVAAPPQDQEEPPRLNANQQAAKEALARFGQRYPKGENHAESNALASWFGEKQVPTKCADMTDDQAKLVVEQVEALMEVPF